MQKVIDRHIDNTIGMRLSVGEERGSVNDVAPPLIRHSHRLFSLRENVSEPEEVNGFCAPDRCNVDRTRISSCGQKKLQGFLG